MSDNPTGMDSELGYESGEPLIWSELAETSGYRRLRRKKLSQFIAGPLPLPHFFIAADLPGKALAVWLLIHFRTRITKRAEVTLPADLLAQIGAGHPGTKARALRSLEDAGLIHVDRAVGRSPRITLIELEALSPSLNGSDDGGDGRDDGGNGRAQH
jgi:hypothetical protein